MTILTNTCSQTSLNLTKRFEVTANESLVRYTLSCEREKATEKLVALRAFADYIFDRTSKIFRLRNEECRVTSFSDPLLDLKLQAQSFVIHNTVLQNLVPDEICAFASELRNGKIAYFGFASYPVNKVVNNKTVTLHDGLCSYWKASVKLASFGEFVSNSRYTSETLRTFFKEVEELGIKCKYQIC